MPDGLTHIAAAYLGVHRFLTKESLILFLVGTLLPDICLRAGRLMFMGHPEHDFLELYLTPLHTPFTSFFVCLALAQFFHAQIRKRALLFLYLGGLWHFFLDFLQRTIEGPGLSTKTIGGYHWLFPFSWLDAQFGIFWAESTPYALIVLLPAMIWISLQQKNKHGMIL